MLVYIAIFLTGFSAGVYFYRKLIETMLREPRSMCDLCEYKRKKEELFPRK